METHKKIREHISALSDGALCDSNLELAMAAMQTADGRQAWHLYHRIGDVLRAQAAPELSDGFADKLTARLAEESVPMRRPSKSEEGGAAATHSVSVTQAPAPIACDVGPEGMAVSQAKPSIVRVS